MKDAYKTLARLCVFWTGDSKVPPYYKRWAKEDDGNGVLIIITKVQTMDFGTYVCTASAGQFVVSDKT